MDPDRFRQIRNVFDAAVEREGSDRTTFVLEACHGDEVLRSEVERLLAAHDRPFDLLEEAAAPSGRVWSRRMEGRRIGAYEILRELGSGGMGTVYLAARADSAFRRLVAIKIMAPEPANGEFTRRFHRERDILASLDHANIARLFDGGTTEDGQPFFVMEYVDGVAIDRYCDEHKLSISERLELFRQVCSAVEYAHKQGVIHRDLKPQNIFVTGDGTVKLLDFGIAKVLHKRDTESVLSLTAAGMRLMTPEYASPEQVRGDVAGTASDLYSLAVVLYELLTGHRPYRLRSRIYNEIVRVICEETPTKPSTTVTRQEEISSLQLNRTGDTTPEAISRLRCGTPSELRNQLKGNLDNILLKALRKDPNARYKSAAEFDDDLVRHLNGVAVRASSGNVGYLLRSWIRQYQMWIVGAVVVGAGFATGAIHLNLYGIMFIAIVGPTILLGYIITRVQRGREVAEKQIRWFVPFMLCVFVLAMAVNQLPHPEWIIAISMGMVAVWGLSYAVRWRNRDSWAGALLLDLSIPLRKSRLMPIIFAVAALAQVIALIGKSMTHSIHISDAIYTVAITSIFAMNVVFGNRVELREKGVVAQGRLIRWARISAYTWRQGRKDQRIAILKVRSGLMALVPGLQLIVDRDKEEAVTSILDRYLAEWPIL